MPEKKRKGEAAGDGGGASGAASAAKKAKGGGAAAAGGAGPGGLGATPATAGINGCAALPGDVLMPWVGLGTYKFKDPKDAQRSIGHALELGYRAIDTAFIYNNQKTERAVGACLATKFAKGELKREDIFITTKHWRKYHGYDETLKCLKMSLRALQVEVIDLWLMHWPGPGYWTMSRSKVLLQQHGPWYFALGAPHRPEPVPGQTEQGMAALRAETWRAMENAVTEGKVRAIGVSNFTVAHLETLRRTAKSWPPAVNQVEFHPYLAQSELLAYCKKHGIILQAYASLGGQDAGKAKLAPLGGPLLEHAAVLSAAANHGVSAAQVLLRWALQKGVAVIPKASSKERVAINAELHGFNLSAAEVAELDALERPAAESRLCWRTDPMRLLDFE